MYTFAFKNTLATVSIENRMNMRNYSRLISADLDDISEDRININRLTFLKLYITSLSELVNRIVNNTTGEISAIEIKQHHISAIEIKQHYNRLMSYNLLTNLIHYSDENYDVPLSDAIDIY